MATEITVMMRIFLKKVVLLAGSCILLHGSLSAASLFWNQDRGWMWDVTPSGKSAQPEIMGKAMALMDQAKRKQDAGNLSAAKSIYESVVKTYGDTLYAAESLFQIGLIEEKNQNWERSFKSFQRIIDNYPGYGDFNKVVSAQFQVADGLMQGNRVRFLGTIPIFKSPSTAIEQFEQIIQNAPFGEYAPLALLNIALLYRSKGAPEETIHYLDRFINTYPRHFLLPDAYLLMAQTYASLIAGPEYDQGATRDAIGYYEDFLIQFPRSSRAAEAERGLKELKEILGTSKLIMGNWYYTYRGNDKAATIIFNEVETVAPGTEAADDARALLNRIKEGKPAPYGFFARLANSFGLRQLDDDSVTYSMDSGPRIPEMDEARPAGAGPIPQKEQR
jgi:outer membrane protein assembly factor BamD